MKMIYRPRPGTTIVTWRETLLDAGRCIAKYIVQAGPGPGAPSCCDNKQWAEGFAPVNDPDPTGYGGGTIFTSYIHAAVAASDNGGGEEEGAAAAVAPPPPRCSGCCYRVQARDYWGALGPFSNVTCPAPK